MNANIYSVLDDDIDDNEIEKLKISNVPSNLNKQVNFDLGEQEVILPIKKKKGRKSKKDKQLELEALERNKVPPKLFPNLNEKIFDVIEIGGKEYFLDPDFGIIHDENTNQVGIKRKSEYILYSKFNIDIDKIESQLKLDNEEVEQIIKLHIK